MTEEADRPTRARVTLTSISSRAWEHPADRGALTALRQLKGFDTILRKISGMVNERAERLVYLASAVRADDRQFPRVHRLFAEAAATLDIRELPELYVMTGPYPNALCIGIDKPIIVLHSSLVDLLDDEELRFVLGHELGHARSGHALYQSLLMWLIRLSGVIQWVPLGVLGIRAIIAALYEWSRKAELSGDRAGLLAAQDPAAALRTHMKLASGGHLEDVDATAFLAQAAEYDGSGDLRDSVLKLLLLEARTHPFLAVRAAELRHWVDNGDYNQILAGNYPRREDDGDAKISEEAKKAADAYKEQFQRSQDPLMKILNDLGGTIDGVRDKVTGWFSGNRGGGGGDSRDN
ncbi:M48 family metallopeptidase [Tenggerimyces flavus]|uniref:M48 family metallopeptidase n=1 Tax=Tenggerimyces flavus TaxID=1708749 RepID=A0ABV7Y593_9ACTN|nr:M48 family metallopeptidase [Tenggerimyces flavus]MBM7788456.1 Zn-dependent protease with chaperone function [Tenggerimyces flavus]